MLQHQEVAEVRYNTFGDGLWHGKDQEGTTEPWLHFYKCGYHNAKTILFQGVQRQEGEIAPSKFRRFVGEMARRRQRALTGDGIAVIATFLN